MARIVIPGARTATTTRRLVTPAGGWWTGAGSVFFDGTDDRVDGAGGIAGNGACTLAVTIFPIGTKTVHATALYSGTAAVLQGWWIGGVADATGDFIGGGCYGTQVATTYRMRTKEWQRIVLTYPGGDNKSYKVYINGGGVATSAAVTPAIAGAGADIGVDANHAAPLGGHFFDARIYSREWSAVEVAKDARGEWVSATGLIRHWPLESISGGKTPERIGNTLDNVTGALLNANMIPFRARTASPARTAA